MKQKRWHTDRLHWPGRRHTHDASEADRLTPLEETDEFKRSHQTEGHPGAADDTIRIDNTKVKMPEHLVEDEREGSSIFRLEPVVLFILLAMIAFIAFIAWQITLMPEK